MMASIVCFLLIFFARWTEAPRAPHSGESGAKTRSRVASQDELGEECAYCHLRVPFALWFYLPFCYTFLFSQPLNMHLCNQKSWICPRPIKIEIFGFLTLLRAAMAQWIRRLPTEQKILGSSPSCCIFLLFSSLFLLFSHLV